MQEVEVLGGIASGVYLLPDGRGAVGIAAQVEHKAGGSSLHVLGYFHAAVLRIVPTVAAQQRVGLLAPVIAMRTVQRPVVLIADALVPPAPRFPRGA